MKDKIKLFLQMTGGTLLITIGIYFFKFPNNFSTGGVSGIAVILGKLTTLSPGTYVLIINMILLVLGFVFVGKGFGIRTVYCCVLQSASTYLLEFIYPMNKPFTDEPLLELLIAIFLVAAGSAVLFNIDASTGGTDIVAMIIKKYSNFNISAALFIADCAIVMAAFFVFGIETWLFCVVGFAAKSLFVNTMLESINLSKFCTVIVKPEYEQQICDFITKQLGRSATVSGSFTGAYNNEQKSVILLVLNRHQTILLKKFVKKLDQKAFMIISNTSEVCGKGFKGAI